MGPRRDWSLLPDEPIEQIANHLLEKDLTEYVRFRAVCQSWRRPTADPHNFSNRFRPYNWILLMDHDGSITGQPRQFLNISTGNVLRVHVPELCYHDYIVSAVADGLLFLRHIKTGCLFLLNPFTRAMAHLPKFVSSVRPGERWRYHFITGAVVTSSLTVILCSSDSRLIAIAKLGDQFWQLINQEEQFFTSLLFNGCLYAVHNTITQFKSDTKQLVPVVPYEIGARSSSYLLESDGQMLLVCVHNDARRHRNYGISYIKIFKVEPNNSRLVQVKSIGDRALFIGRFRCLSVSTKVFPSIQRNCVYLGTEKLSEIGIYNIGKFDFYASPKSSLVIQLVSYCHHITWQKYLSYDSLTTEQVRTIPWDGEEEKRDELPIWLENEYFLSPAPLSLVIPTCGHAVQSSTWQGSCTHGFSSYSNLLSSKICRFITKRSLMCRELYAALLNPSFYDDLKIDRAPTELKNCVLLVLDSDLLEWNMNETSFCYQLGESEWKTVKINGICLMEKRVKETDQWQISDWKLICDNKEFYHIIQLLQKKERTLRLRTGKGLAKNLKEIKDIVKEAIEEDDIRLEYKEKLAEVISRVDKFLISS